MKRMGPVRLPLRIFLFAALSVATLGPIAYLGSTQVRRWRTVQRQHADQELRFAAELLARTVGQAMDASVRGLTTLASHIGTYGSFDAIYVQPVLHQYCANFPSCLGVNLSNLDARPVVIEPPRPTEVRFADREYFQHMERTGRTAVSGVEMGRITGVPTVHVAAPVWGTVAGERRRLGAVVGALGLAYLQEQASRAVEIFADMQARVLDQHGRVIVDSSPAGQLALADLSGLALYAEVAPGPAQLRDGYNADGLPVRVAVATVTEQHLGWTVAVMRPVHAIEEQAGRARASAWIAVWAALGLGMAFAFVLSSWLARPISRLARYTQRVAEGSVAPAPVTAEWDAREVTDLVSTVGAMVERLRQQADALRAHEHEQVELARLKRELEIAEHIQTGVLPRRFVVPGFEVAGRMVPAEVVGGDYYDVLPTSSGVWLGVGDVSGHGLNAGLVMLMLQSALGAVSGYAPRARPAELWAAANRLLVGNIRERLGGDDHVTLVIVHLEADGRFVFAGGHEPVLILRKGSASCEVVATPGPWLGIRAELASPPLETTGQLGPGDLMVLHSDGIVEAGAADRELFGLERLSAAVERLRDRPGTVMCEEILREARAWTAGPPDDDMTILVIRRAG